MLHRHCGPTAWPERATEVKPTCETAAACDPLRPDLKVWYRLALCRSQSPAITNVFPTTSLSQQSVKSCKNPEVLSKHHPHFLTHLMKDTLLCTSIFGLCLRGQHAKNIIISLTWKKKILCVSTRTRADTNRLQLLLLYSTVISVGKLFFHPTHCTLVISYIVLCYLSKYQSKPAFRVFSLFNLSPKCTACS